MGVITRTLKKLFFKKRENFSEDVVEYHWQKQKGKCPCCGRSLSHVDWNVHHKDGYNFNNSLRNCVLVCIDCHHNCYHGAPNQVPRKPKYCRIMD